MLRVWAEDLGNGQAEWRGKVEHVTSGQVYYFRDWARLTALLLEMLEPCEAGQHKATASDLVRPDDAKGRD